MKKILISGYYGFDNTGDEAVLQAIIDALKQQDLAIKPIVLSANPDKTTKQYNVDAINRFAFKDVLQAIKEADGLISGGGSLLQDETGLLTIPYYTGIIKLAQIFNKPTFIYSQGVGPVNRKVYYPLIRNAFNKSKYISVRDKESAMLLKEIGIPLDRVDVVTDPVLNLVPISQECVSDIFEREGITKQPILISVRFWKEDKTYLEEIAKAADELVRMGEQVAFIPMHEPNDREASEYVLNRMEEEAILLNSYDARTILGIMGESKCVIGMRLHSLIFAVAMGVPVIGISYDPKIDTFLASLGQTPVGTTEDLNYRVIFDQVKHVIQHLEDNQQELNKRLPALKELAIMPAKNIATYFNENK